jgi:hexokinase
MNCAFIEPLGIVKDLDNQEVMETEEATFTIELNKPDQKVVWYHKGKKVVAGDKYVMSSEGNVYKFVIKGCTLDDTADVKMMVEKLKPTAKLTVKGIQFEHQAWMTNSLYNRLLHDAHQILLIWNLTID